MVWGVLAMMGISAIQGANASEASGEQNQIIHEYNAKIARIQAKQAIVMGEEDVIKIRDQEKALQSEQTAAFAGQGIDLSSDVVSDTEAHTQAVIDDEIAIVRNNARTRAWGLEAQATQDVTAGQVARQRGRTEALGSVLGGASNMAMAGMDYRAGNLSGMRNNAGNHYQPSMEL